MNLQLSEQEQADLTKAVRLLENPGFITRLEAAVGSPLQHMIKRMPGPLSRFAMAATKRAVGAALTTAMKTVRGKAPAKPAIRMHRTLAMMSGGCAGFFGLPGLAVELPVTTTLIMRAIADIARWQGEPMTEASTRMACMEVFALGSPSKEDDEAPGGYFAVRAALSKSLTEAATHVAEKGVTSAGAPVMVRLISQLSSRFGITVSEKVAAQAIPIVGAFGGAAVNLIFMRHFQRTAIGHFTVRRLERAHGTGQIAAEYQTIKNYSA